MFKEFLKERKTRKEQERYHKNWISMVNRIQASLNADSIGKRRIYKLIQIFDMYE